MALFPLRCVHDDCKENVASGAKIRWIVWKTSEDDDEVQSSVYVGKYVKGE